MNVRTVAGAEGLKGHVVATGWPWVRKLVGAIGSIYTEYPQKVRSSQSVTKQVDRKSSMDRSGHVGSPGVTDEYG